MKKRKTTTKRIGGKTIVTNPKFTTDIETPLPLNLWCDVVDTMKKIYLAGIAIGRARATASGVRKGGKK